MYKFWILRKSKNNILILIKDQIIYKGNPKEKDYYKINSETTNFTFLNELFSIPYSYIKSVEMQKGNNHIKIYFGKDSEEELYISNEKIKVEVFQYIRNDSPSLKYSSLTPSILNYAKAPLFALLSITAIFIWALYLAIQMESGVEYQLIGNGNPGITGIVLAIANLGSLKLIIGYSVLLGISILALVKRLRSRSEFEYLKR